MISRSAYLLPMLVLGFALAGSQAFAQGKQGDIYSPGNPHKPDGKLRGDGEHAGKSNNPDCPSDWEWTTWTLNGKQKDGYRRRAQLPCQEAKGRGIVE